MSYALKREFPPGGRTDMSDEWRDAGPSNDASNWPGFNLLPGGHERLVQNLRTGEYRKVWVYDGEDVGDAIRDGRMKD